jgi:DNA-binding MarR family transcriptional regulator
VNLGHTARRKEHPVTAAKKATASVPELLAATHLPGSPLSDGLVDTIDRSFRRLRKSMIKPPSGLVPVPSLGHPLEFAKIAACDAIDELAQTSPVVSVKDVAAALDLEHSTVSRLLSEIEDDGLLVRGEHPQDRRRTTVELTDLGRAVVSDATAMTRFFTRALLSEWPVEDVQALSRLITKLADTVHSRLAALPELAMAEFCRVHEAPTPTDDH